MKFKYQARTKEGELQAGFVDAGNRDTALQILASHDLFVLSVVSAEEKQLVRHIHGFREPRAAERSDHFRAAARDAS